MTALFKGHLFRIHVSFPLYISQEAEQFAPVTSKLAVPMHWTRLLVVDVALGVSTGLLSVPGHMADSG